MNVAVLPKILDDDRIGELLSLWARWMRSSQPLRELWYPDTAAGCVGGGYGLSFEDLIEANDKLQAEAVNSAIEGLTPAEQCSVYHVHLASVFRGRAPMEKTYEEARYQLRVILPSRGIY